VSRFPFPAYPNGWYQVAYGDDLEPGEVRSVHYFGRDLVVFRGEDGTARTLDAYCPHLGAHLGVGGKVVDDSIRCPFHHWRFDGTGACVEVPYANKIPPKARVECWPTCEVNGLIMVWHHAQKQPPGFELPALPEHGSDDWTPYERRHWRLRTHPQEMGENLVDAAHFRYVHGTLTLAEGNWEPNGPHLHVLNTAKMRTPKGDIEGTIDTNVYGPGFAVIRFEGIVETLLVESTTPVDGDLTDVNFSFSVRKLGNEEASRRVGQALIADIEKQIEEDAPIWENKIYLDRPVLCDGDGPIVRWRRWYQQFYSDDAAGAV
jgi:phenylpropionate dioxygenase-like ring-hydroxylating dioxygenase large terminal subunit